MFHITYIHSFISGFELNEARFLWVRDDDHLWAHVCTEGQSSFHPACYLHLTQLTKLHPVLTISAPLTLLLSSDDSWIMPKLEIHSSSCSPHWELYLSFSKCSHCLTPSPNQPCIQMWGGMKPCALIIYRDFMCCASHHICTDVHVQAAFVAHLIHLSLSVLFLLFPFSFCLLRLPGLVSISSLTAGFSLH